MTISLNWVDIIVVLVLAVSSVLGFMRGLTREVLGIGGWVGALLITLYGLVFARILVQPYINNPFVVDIVAALALFLISLTLLIFISRHISLKVKGSILGSLDRSLGIGFGFARGGALLCITLLMASFIWKPAQWPDPVKTARSSEYVAKGANWMKNMVPNEAVKNLGLNTNSEPIVLARNELSTEDLVIRLSQPGTQRHST